MTNLPAISRKGVVAYQDRSRHCGCGARRLSYLNAYSDAVRRLGRGERQLWCGTCDGWVWPDHCDHQGRMTSKGHAAMLRAVRQETRRRYPTQQDRLHNEYVAAVKAGDLK